MVEKYKALFFDVGNTLIVPHPSVEEVCAEILAGHGHRIEKEALKAALIKADHAYEEQYWKDDRFWLSEVDAAAFWAGLYEIMLREVGFESGTRPIAEDIYRAFGQSHRWLPYDDVIPAFKELTAAGYKLGLISNWDTRLPSLMVEVGLAKYLDFVISSASVGWLKPQPQIFELALERASVLAVEAMHIGDHYYADVMGARSVGITPVMIDRFEKVNSSDCLLIKNLSELVDHLS